MTKPIIICMPMKLAAGMHQRMCYWFPQKHNQIMKAHNNHHQFLGLNQFFSTFKKTQKTTEDYPRIYSLAMLSFKVRKTVINNLEKLFCCQY